MNVKLVVLGALALMTAPLAYAHNPPGTPKNYCEHPSEWTVHDYAAPIGFSSPGNMDGNVLGGCDNRGLDFGSLGTPCAGFDDPADPLSFYAGLCDADIFLPASDRDGHAEWALGGALILACDWNCGASGSGAGTVNCLGVNAHHADHGTFYVNDIILGSEVVFTITADHTPPWEPCGDFEVSHIQVCRGSCDVSFGAGLDGTYQVDVQGTLGHIITT